MMTGTYLIVALWIGAKTPTPLLYPGTPKMTMTECQIAVERWNRYFDKRLSYPPKLSCVTEQQT
jgi:hypothetical protein